MLAVPGAAQDQDQNPDQNPDQSQRQSHRSETALNNTSADIDNNESASAPAVAVAASEADSSSSFGDEDDVPPLRSADELRTLAVKLFAVGAIRSRIDMLVSFLPAVVILLAIYLSN